MSEAKSTSAIKFAIIPAILAIGALYWLFFISDLHVFRRTLSQENRHAEIVGAKTLPVDPIKLIPIQTKKDCAVIDRLEVDGSKLWVYWHNRCTKTLDSTKIGVKGKAPDGTIITSFWHFLPGANVEPGEHQESAWDVEDDPRIVSIEVSLYE